jgi:uncharacterized membrane protein YdjX (TVP38/TMEM64 family)
MAGSEKLPAEISLMRKTQHEARNVKLAASRSTSRNRGAHQALLFGLTKHKRALWTAVTTVAVVVIAVVLVVLYTDVSWENIIGWIDRVNPVLALPLMALLPIVGFPIAIVYLFAGARFGPLGGGAVVAAITAIHLVGTYLIARSFLRAPLQRLIEKKHKHLPEIPEDEQAAVCVIATLVPGLPYFVRNYLLALGGVKLKYFFTVCLPIYVARSYVTILLGDMGNDPSRNKLFILLTVDVLKVAICALVIWRLRVHHRKYHGHHDDANEHPADVAPPPNAAAK